MPRGIKNRYRVNYKIYWGTGSLGSMNDRDLTPREFVARLREVAQELINFADHEERVLNEGDAAQKAGR